MDDDFFADQGETVTIPTQPTQNIPNSQVNMDVNEDEFEFQNSNQFPSQLPSNDNFAFQSQEQDQTLKKVREEEDRILQTLRQKANQEYEEKQKRKEKGRLELDEFLEKKKREVDQRKIENKEKEAKLKEERQKINVDAGWKKVAMNIALKQGQHEGKKDINRMREAIINKKNDEL